MRIKFVDWGKQYEAHRYEYADTEDRLNMDGKLILGEELEEFEQNLAKYMGMKYAVGVASGTDALILGLKAKGITKKPISTSGYTFKATMEAIKHTGNFLNVVDIYRDVIFKDRLMKSAYGLTLPVHIEGKVSVRENAVMEDACQAFGAKGVGYSGTIALSHYPFKILGTKGDGGSLVTNDKKVADKARLLRHHWQTDKNEEYGFSSRLDNLKAAQLNIKLKYIDEALARREKISIRYRNNLRNVPIKLPTTQGGRVWQDFVIEVDEPEKLKVFLNAKGIEVLGVGMIPPHKALNMIWKLPNTEKLYSRMMRLPCNETLEDFEIDYVIDMIKKFYE